MAVGLSRGFLQKQARRKSSIFSDAPAGRGGMSSSTILNMAVMASRLEYGGRPVKSSMMVHARDQMSLANDGASSLMTSGATAEFLALSAKWCNQEEP